MFQLLTLAKLNITYAVKFLVLLTVAAASPLIGLHSQWLTGPLVNAALILAVYLLGIRGALLIGLLPSTIALGTGLLPAPLAPMVPFIIIANVILVLVIDWFKNKFLNYELRIRNYGLGLIFSAGLKYFFLLTTSAIVVKLLIKQELAVKVVEMMNYPQFFTAMIGGAIAYGFLRILRKPV